MQRNVPRRCVRRTHLTRPCCNRTDTPTKPRLLILDEDRIILQSLGAVPPPRGVRGADDRRSPDDAVAPARGRAGRAAAGRRQHAAASKPAEFLRDVRRRFPHVVVVVITGYGSIEGAVEATKIGAFDYLTKPIVDEEIRVVVEKAARQQSLLFENQALRQQLDLRFGLENVVGHDHGCSRSSTWSRPSPTAGRPC